MVLSLSPTRLDHRGTSATSVPAVVPPVDSTSSLFVSLQAVRSHETGLSKSAALMSGILNLETNTRRPIVVPSAALTMGLAILTLRPKLGRLNREPLITC